jgi:DNA-binding CsgD family transcriptional regulator
VDAALLNVIRAIHRSDNLDEFERAFLGQAAIEAQAFGIYLLNPQLPIPRKFFGMGAPPAFLEEYEGYRALDPIYDFVTRERSVADGAHLLGGREWRSHPLRQWLHRWGWPHSLQGPVLIRGQLAGTVNFARGTAGGAFTERSRRLAHVICEEVGAALEKLLERSEIAAELNLFTACFDNAPLPLVICDARGTVRVMNQRARPSPTSVPGASPPDAPRGDPLCRVAHVVGELAASSQEALALRTDAGETIMSVRLQGCDDLFLAAWDYGGDSANHLGALPERARAVAELLIQGRQNKWIAWKLGISHDTVKYHVRRVYSLLGISSRIELVRLATQPRKQ